MIEDKIKTNILTESDNFKIVQKGNDYLNNIAIVAKPTLFWGFKEEAEVIKPTPSSKIEYSYLIQQKMILDIATTLNQLKEENEQLKKQLAEAVKVIEHILDNNHICNVGEQKAKRY